MDLPIIDVNPRIDEHFAAWLHLSPSDFKIVLCLARAAGASPDGLSDLSIEQIAQSTALSWRTVEDRLRDLHTRSVIRLFSSGTESTLVGVPGVTGWYGLPWILTPPQQ